MTKSFNQKLILRDYKKNRNSQVYISHMFIVHRSCGFVHVVAEEVADSKYDVTMELYAKKLDKKDFFGKVRSYKIRSLQHNY